MNVHVAFLCQLYDCWLRRMVRSKNKCSINAIVTFLIHNNVMPWKSAVRITGPLWGESMNPITTSLVKPSFDVFFVGGPEKLLNKQSVAVDSRPHDAHVTLLWLIVLNTLTPGKTQSVNTSTDSYKCQWPFALNAPIIHTVHYGRVSFNTYLFKSTLCPVLDVDAVALGFS